MVEEKKEKVEEVLGSSLLASRILIKPVVTEASTTLAALNKYVFKVAGGAAKREIKKAVEELYKVTVLKVHTVRIPKKLRQYGRTPGWVSGFKKAIVTLKAGDSIEIFKKA